MEAGFRLALLLGVVCAVTAQYPFGQFHHYPFYGVGLPVYHAPLVHPAAQVRHPVAPGLKYEGVFPADAEDCGGLADGYYYKNIHKYVICNLADGYPMIVEECAAGSANPDPETFFDMHQMEYEATTLCSAFLTIYTLAVKKERVWLIMPKR